MTKNNLDDKYAQLLLEKCLSFKNTSSLLIDYQTKEHDDFVRVVAKKAREMGISDIGFLCEDKDAIAKYLNETKLDDITLQPFFDYSLLDEYALKRGCILHITTFIPNIMEDVAREKINKMLSLKLKTFNNYRMLTSNYSFPFCVASYPNQRWAEKLFPSDDNAYDKLYKIMMEACMIDVNNPILEWEKFKMESNYYKKILNSLKIKKLYYQNAIGTNFTVGLPENVSWLNFDKTTINGESIIVNFPSYEIFTTPDNRTASGIVYSSNPLVFQGRIIEDFYLVFKDGVVVDYNARTNKELLAAIINNYSNSNRLGEVAFVDYDTRISKTNLTFFDTLFDENGSHHLALGNGKASLIPNGEHMTKEQLTDHGINVAPIHLDFMIGSRDMEIVADTEKGKVKIISNGNFCL